MLKTYQHKLEEIQNDIVSLGNNIIEANKLMYDVLKKGQDEKINDAKKLLKNVVKVSNEIDTLIVGTLALYSPEARDLRELVSYLKITNDLMRAGTNTKTFVKIVQSVNSTDNINYDVINEYSIPMQKAAVKSLEYAMSMINIEDEDKIKDIHNKVCVEESKTDDLYMMIEKNLLKEISKNYELSKEYFDILSSMRRLEKTADRAISIANLLMFAKIGGEIHQL